MRKTNAALLLLLLVLCASPAMSQWCNHTAPTGWWYDCWCNGAWAYPIYIENSQCLTFQENHMCWEFTMTGMQCGADPTCVADVVYNYSFDCNPPKGEACDPEIEAIAYSYLNAKGKVDISHYIVHAGVIFKMPRIHKPNPDTGQDAYLASQLLFKVSIDATGSLSDISYVPQSGDLIEHLTSSIENVRTQWRFLRTGRPYKLLIRVLNLPK
jgi:hypothetical protein